MIWVWIWLIWLRTFKLLSNLSSLWTFSNFWTHFYPPIIFQWDLWKGTTWHTNCLIFAFSNFHPHFLRDTTSWKSFLKKYCIWSSLIECQSSHSCKIDVDPIYCLLMFLLCLMHVLCMTRCIQVHRIRILMVFVHGIHKKKECLCVAQILSSRYQSRIVSGMKIDCTSDMVKVLEEVARNYYICRIRSMRLRPEWTWRARRQWIFHERSVQYWNLFLFPPTPAMLSSTCRQTHDHDARIFLKIVCDSPEFNCSNHLLWWNLHNGRKWLNFIQTAVSGSGHSPCSTSVQNSWPNWNGCLWKNLHVLVFVVLLWHLFGMQNPSPPISTRLLRTELLRFLAYCCSNSWPTSWRHEKVWPKSENCLSSKTRYSSQHHICRANNRLQFPTWVQFCSLESNLECQWIFHLLAKCFRDMHLIL